MSLSSAESLFDVLQLPFDLPKKFVPNLPAIPLESDPTLDPLLIDKLKVREHGNASDVCAIGRHHPHEFFPVHFSASNGS